MGRIGALTIPGAPVAYPALTSSLASSLWLDVVLLVALVLLFGVGMRGAVRRWPRARPAADAGLATTLQFVLVTPLLLAILLTVFQIALIMHAKLVVNYAAFAAVRSAIVMLPAYVEDDDGVAEEPNVMNVNQVDAPKLSAIRRAAALACVGISPPASVKLLPVIGVPDGTGLASLLALSVAFRVDGSEQIVTRAPYALSQNNTQVTVTVDDHPSDDDTGTDYALVTVRVRYRYYLTVPFASRLFGTRYEGLGFFSGAYYLAIEEEYTLPSETDPIFSPEDV